MTVDQGTAYGLKTPTYDARLTEVVRGTLDDLAGLRAAASKADGVVHLGYNHDFSRMAAAAKTDRAAIDACADLLRAAEVRC